MKASLTSFEQSARPTSSQISRFDAGSLRMYSGNRSIFTRVAVPSSRMLTLSRPGSAR